MEILCRIQSSAIIFNRKTVKSILEKGRKKRTKSNSSGWQNVSKNATVFEDGERVVLFKQERAPGRLKRLYEMAPGRLK